MLKNLADEKSALDRKMDELDARINRVKNVLDARRVFEESIASLR